MKHTFEYLQPRYVDINLEPLVIEVEGSLSELPRNGIEDIHHLIMSIIRSVEMICTTYNTDSDIFESFSFGNDMYAIAFEEYVLNIELLATHSFAVFSNGGTKLTREEIGKFNPYECCPDVGRLYKTNPVFAAWYECTDAKFIIEEKEPLALLKKLHDELRDLILKNKED